MPAAPVAPAEPWDLMVEPPMWSRIYLAAEQLSHVQRPSRSPLRCGQEVYLAAEPLNHVQRRAAHPCIFSDRAAQDIWTREHFLFERAHMKREIFQSDKIMLIHSSQQINYWLVLYTCASALKMNVLQIKPTIPTENGYAYIRACITNLECISLASKRALVKDRGDLFVHFLYVYLASASTNAIAVQAPN